MLNQNKNAITCWLAIDSRIIESSVYEENRMVFERAKIDGNNFLEKIIQLPFCIPNITQDHRICFMDRLFFQLDPYGINNGLNKLAEDVRLMKFRKGHELDDQLEIFYKYWKTFISKNEIEILKCFNEFLMEVSNDGSTSNKIKKSHGSESHKRGRQI